MLHTHWKRHGLALAAMASLAVCTAGAQDPKPGAAEKIGERLDDAGAAIRRGVDKAGDAVKDQYNRAKASIHSMGVEGRVYGRLHWDRALQGATIEVSAARDGTVTLSGSVADAAAKSKAVTLAADTVGVAKVVDQLGIAPPASTTTPAP